MGKSKKEKRERKLKELQVRTKLITEQIKISKVCNQPVAAISFPNSTRIEEDDIEQILETILGYKPQIFNKISCSTVGKSSVSVWTIELK